MMDSSSVFEKQRMLDDERDCLLEPDSDESAADEAETPHMEIRSFKKGSLHCRKILSKKLISTWRVENDNSTLTFFNLTHYVRVD